MTEAYPLVWPAGWPRQASRQRSDFGKNKNEGVSVAQGIAEVHDELRKLGARSVVISTNIELKQNGLPYSGRKAPDDPGVAAYFTLAGVQKCIPVDRWDRVGDNLRAIAKTIDAMRGIERWGAKNLVDAAFRGFQSLPPPDGSAPSGVEVVGRPWHEVLGVRSDAPSEIRRAAYRALSLKHHPDRGGRREDWDELERAKREARI